MVRQNKDSSPSTPSLSLPQRSGRKRLLLAIVLAAGLVCGVYTFVSWRQWTRPGMAHYLRGMDALSAHKPREAERQWLLGTREDPTQPMCYEQLGDLYTELQRFRDAAAAYAAAAQRSPKDGTLYLRQARAERLIGHTEEALVAAKRAADLLPDDADAVGGYGVLQAERKGHAAALAALERAHALRPADRRYFIALESTRLDVLDIVGAERDLTPYVQAHPNDPQASYLMAVVINQKPRTPENVNAAVAYARRALAGIPDDMRVCTLLGQLYLDTGRTQEALQIYQAGERREPNNDGVQHGLVVCYSRLNDVPKRKAAADRLETIIRRRDRVEHLKHTLGFNHNDMEAGLELARLVAEAGEYRMALGYYAQLMRQAPQDPRPRQALSVLFQRHKRPDLAKAALRPDFSPDSLYQDISTTAAPKK